MTAKNNFFDAGRLCLYLRLRWQESKKILFSSALLIYASLTFIYCWYGYTIGSWCYYRDVDVQDFAWSGVDFIGFCFLFFMALLLGSLSFRVLSTRAGRLSFFTLPVSQFEKFLVAWLGTIALLWACFGLVWLADLTRVFVVNLTSDGEIVALPVPWLAGDGVWNNRPFASLTGSLRSWMSLLLASSFFQLGALIWQRLSFLKTGLVLFCGTLLLAFTLFQLDRLLFNPDFYYPHMDAWRGFFFEEGQGYLLLMGICTLFNWVMTYFRLKETELVHRL